MATLRPQIIRADTLDLQDHDAPSAQDHTHQPYHPDPLGTGPPAPHQGQSLRTLEQDRSAEQGYLADAWGSGRSSHEGSDLLNDDEADSDDDGNERINNDHELDNDDGSPGEEIRLDDAARQSSTAGSTEATDTDTDADADADTDTDDDMVDDRISSSPSIPDDEAAEQDDGFVWALHNFVATVEGQANATKGDVMVLLDDSNSYWWLVRVVKDSSIGYLPAEHIETHTERLARYNKHRNLEFSQTMLTDTQEKSKNPLKKAMRRRNAKQVQFSTPTFYDPPSELDWSDVENESDNEDDRTITDSSADSQQQTDQTDKTDEIESLGPKTNGTTDELADSSISRDSAGTTSAESSRSALDASRPDNDTLEQDSTPRRTRNGTMRNTDSFFNDNTAEPRKISLTPNLLREGSEDGGVRNGPAVAERASGSQESFEHIEKPSSSSSAEKPKDDKKKKEKKPGMLSGLFKRKDKKIKVDEAAGGTVVKHEDDSGSPVLTPGDTGSPSGRTSPTAKIPQSPQQPKKPSGGAKLSKAAPSSTQKQTNEPTTSADSSKGQDSTSTQPPSTFSPTQTQHSRDFSDGSGPKINDPSGYLSSGPTSANEPDRTKPEIYSSVDTAGQSASDTVQMDSTEEKALESASTSQARSLDQGKPQDAKASTNSDRRNMESSVVDYANNGEPKDAEKSMYPLSLSPHPRKDEQQARAIPANAPISSSSPPSEHSITNPLGLTSTFKNSSSSANATISTRGTSDTAWNAVALKNYLANQSNDDARNMLILIQNQTDVTPLPLDHPTMLALGYHEHQKRLNEMSTQLDGLLQGFLARRAARPKPTQR